MAVAIATNKNKKNTGTYAQWVTDTETNAKIENTDQTPSAASTFWEKLTASANSAANAAANGGKLDIKYDVVSPGNVDASGAPIGSPTTPYTETEDFAKWVADNGFTHENGKINTNPTVTTPTTSTPTTDTPEAGGTGKEETKTETDTKTETKTPVTDESGFSKWLATDPEMQARMRAAETDYYKNLATYGAQGEALAQSGLVGSGWSEYLKGNAYSAMQAEKAGVRSEGYAKWLADNETTSGTNGTISAGGSDIVKSVIESGATEITDSTASLLAGLGHSAEEIEEAKKALAEYDKSVKAEEKKAFSDALTTFTTEGNATKFLQAIGVDTATIGDADDEIIRRVEDAYESGTIDDATRSAFYRKALMLDEDFTGKDVDYVAKQAASAVSIETETRKRLTDEDYAAIVDKSYDELGVEKVTFGSGLGSGTRYENINITVNVNGKELTITADHAGEGKVSTEKKDALNKLFGDSTLALYNDKVYFQYDDGEWTEVKTKKWGGSDGSKDTGNAILKVVAAYSGANNVNYKSKDYHITNDNVPANATAEEKRVATVVMGRIKNAEFERFKSGKITREQFVSDFVEDNKQYFKNIGADPEAAVNMYLDWLLG